MRVAWCLTVALTACAFDDEVDDELIDGEWGDEGEVMTSEVELEAGAALVVHNPVVAGCADPGVMRDGAAWYLTCTGGAGGNHFPIYRSTNLLDWTKVGHVFPAGTAPSWASGNWWAPELHHVDGGIAAYFSALDGTTNAVGYAFSPTIVNPTGYAPRATSLVKRSQSTIDAHELTSVNGTHWLYFKLEGQPDTIWGHALTADGKNLTPGPSTKLVTADRSWERGVVEAPWVSRLDGWYYLFYSGAAYCNHTYAVGVARSKHPLGPFTKKASPILKSGDRWLGPGHNSITRGPDGRVYMVYHAYRKSEGIPACGNLPNDNNKRDTLIDRVVIENGWPRVTANL